MKGNSESMTENNEQNHDQSNKKLFQKGGLPGPGRGKKKKQEPLTFDQIELALQKDLTSPDAKVRHPAVKLLLALKKQFGQPSNSQRIDPAVKQALQGYTDDLFSDEDRQEADEGDITD